MQLLETCLVKIVLESHISYVQFCINDKILQIGSWCMRCKSSNNKLCSSCVTSSRIDNSTRINVSDRIVKIVAYLTFMQNSLTIEVFLPFLMLCNIISVSIQVTSNMLRNLIHYWLHSMYTFVVGQDVTSGHPTVFGFTNTPVPGPNIT
jgi:hypothetical protein